MDLLPLCAGSGLILVACSSGAQLSNYVTFLAEPAFAPLSIVMTALSTAAAVVVTPLLTLLLLGRRLHIDLVGMIRNITEIVVAPIAAGLFLNR
jgi:BASS family bile acid:Na+ symporter